MIETLTAYATAKVAAYVGGSIAAFVLAWILKRIDNEKIASKVEAFFHGVGKWITLTASKKSKLWNKVVEPWFVDLIDNVVVAALRGFVAGLGQTTNPAGVCILSWK